MAKAMTEDLLSMHLPFRCSTLEEIGEKAIKQVLNQFNNNYTLCGRQLSANCTHCGACIAICPRYEMNWFLSDPTEKTSCKACLICQDVCHKSEDHFKVNEIEEMVFGRARQENEVFGIHKKVIAAKAKDESILKTCQDGGVVTAIALYLLENNKVDGIIATRREYENGRWKPIPFIATTKEQLLKASGTKFDVAPILAMLKEGFYRGLPRLAVVGLPCQIRSARYLQKIDFEFASAITHFIGLLCTKNYEYEKLEALVKENGKDMKDVDKMYISKGKFYIHSTNGDEIAMPLKNMGDLVLESCEPCEDYSSELADISVGSQGSEEGWSSVIIRTYRGERLISELEKGGYIVTKELDNLDVIVSSCKRKRELSHAKAVRLPASTGVTEVLAPQA